MPSSGEVMSKTPEALENGKLFENQRYDKRRE